ncbi:hypothetical protein BpHYR1_031958 [Brachionus plicatilis]|uniref:Uncharacterized protein n=1 Tax=Brachionus plicatilis TaxID=10195 RepID=A0A3M7S414_BRAPC|nr:hypothetical protein BpHYR1_031958 [Brachionus plicatilis]
MSVSLIIPFLIVPHFSNLFDLHIFFIMPLIRKPITLNSKNQVSRQYGVSPIQQEISCFFSGLIYK